MADGIMKQAGVPELSEKEKVERVGRLVTGCEFDPKTYEIDTAFRPAEPSDPMQVHTTGEMLRFLEKNETAELDARVIGLVKNGKGRPRTKQIRALAREAFVASFRDPKYKMREYDAFNMDSDVSDGGDLVGQDFTPYLGGPFYKNLYYYQDYIRMHAQAFSAYHHNPIAKAIVSITVDFTLGRGFRVDCEDKKALALWRAYEEANDLQALMTQIAKELSIYGETMLWNLPAGESKITYRLGQGDEAPRGVLPRTRLVDPSNIVEIVTYPEDISRQLFYVWLAPTQYQIYSAMTGDTAKAPAQPTLKFIYRQIPAEQMIHFKVNSVSNEKRGRSDLFSVLGYLKLLRDAVNWEMISHQKQASWSIDTAVDGSPTDVDSYIEQQRALGTIPQAGSEFVHTTKIKREMLSAVAGRSGSSEIFEWCLSMIAAGVQIPTTYYGTHIAGSQARGAALVATEPVAKKFEMRQEVYARIVRALWKHVMTASGRKEVPDCEVTFPEIITQDRSAKLKDLALAETQGWISKKTAATISAKELGIDSFEYDEEQAEIAKAVDADMASLGYGKRTLGAPLTTPPAGGDTEPKPGGLTGGEKKAIKDTYGA